MSFVLRRPSGPGTPFTVSELGFTLEPGEERDMTADGDYATDDLFTSTELAAALSGGDLERLDGFGGSVISPSQAFDDSDVSAHVVDNAAHGLQIATLALVTDAGSGQIISGGERTKLSGIEAGAEVNDTGAEILTKLQGETLPLNLDVDKLQNETPATLRNRATHTGTQTASTISDFNSSADARIDAQKNVANGVLALDGSGNATPPGLVDGRNLADDGTKLDGVEAGAEVNDTAGEIETKLQTLGTVGIDVDTVDGQNAADLLNRANHTGTQAASTINNFNNEVDTRIDLQKNAASGILALDASSNVNPPGLVDGRNLADDGTKLDGVEAGAEVNDTGSEIVTKLQGEPTPLGLNVDQVDGQNASDLLARANHTGTQTSSTISDFDAAADARITVQKGAVNGLATLDGTGKVPTAQLPAGAMPRVYVVIAYQSAPPPGPVLNDAYIVEPTGTGAWSGQDNAYAVWNGASWDFTTPNEGDEFRETSGSARQGVFDGSSWAIYASGTGDVAGPGSSTDNTLARFDGATGKTIQGSGIVVDDSDNVTGVGTVNGVIVEDHSDRHDPGGADALSTAAPVTIGTANAEGTGTAFARNDHVHNHGAQTDPAHHAVATGANNGFLSSADKTKLDGLPSNAVPETRDLTAGAGLTGGGNLTADRSFEVGANADGSITVNANDIQVGVLATDGQHGNRGGGALHSDATTSVSGFQSAADKTKLDGIEAGAKDDQNIGAGDGLTGGGTGDVTLNVAANVDGSIVVNTNDIQVGILASDAQHGNRGGGALHAAATGAINGFMSAADKSKLDGYPLTPPVSADGSIDTHSDVDVSTTPPTLNQLLGWDGSNFIPVDPGEAVALVGFQARQSIALALAGATYESVDFDTVDLVGDTNVIDRDPVNTERIVLKEPGAYWCIYSTAMTVSSGATGNIRALFNGTTVVGGTDKTIDGAFGTSTKSFTTPFLVVTTTANEYIEIQGNETGGDITFDSTLVQVIALRAAKGDKGDPGTPGSGSTVNVEDDNVLVPNSPFSIINFGAGLTATDAGGGQVDVVADAGESFGYIYYGKSGDQVFSAETTVNFDRLKRDSAGADFTVATVSGGTEVTCNFTGWVQVSFDVGIDVTSNSRETSRVFLQVNSTTVDDTNAFGYHRQNANGDDSMSLQAFPLQVTTGDVIRVRALDQTGATLSLLANACRLKVEREE